MQDPIIQTVWRKLSSKVMLFIVCKCLQFGRVQKFDVWLSAVQVLKTLLEKEKLEIKLKCIDDLKA